jgi:hypothetical protein
MDRALPLTESYAVSLMRFHYALHFSPSDYGALFKNHVSQSSIVCDVLSMDKEKIRRQPP